MNEKPIADQIALAAARHVVRNARIALCPECGGEGSHEIPQPMPDDPFYCYYVVQCRHCGGVGHVEEDGLGTGETDGL